MVSVKQNKTEKKNKYKININKFKKKKEKKILVVWGNYHAILNCFDVLKLVS